MWLASNVAQITAGTGAYGNWMIDLLYQGGDLLEYRVGLGWSYVAGNVPSISKGQAGLVGLVFSCGDAYAEDGYSYFYLTNYVQVIA